MAIDPTPSATSTVATPKRRSFRLQIVGAVVAMLLAVMVFVTWPTTARHEEFAWLSAAEFAQHINPPAPSFEDKLESWLSPITGWFQKPYHNCDVPWKLVSLPQETIAGINLGPPLATNETGMIAWILAPEKADEVQKRIEQDSKTEVPMPHKIPTRITLNSSSREMLTEGVPQTDMMIDAAAIDARDMVKLAFNFQVARKMTAPETASTTNFACTFRANLFHGSDVVLDGGPVKEKPGRRYWMILSVPRLDANGRPIEANPRNVNE